MEFKRIILEACVLVAFAALFGLTLNHQLVMDAFSGQLVPLRNDADVHIEMQLPVPVLLDEVRHALASGGLVIDARSPELYAEGHIKGAVSLPLVEIDIALPDFIARTPRDKKIIAYCSGFGCPDSFDLGLLLIEEGYADVGVFEGGYPEWHDAGLPVEEGGL
jgi:rhodanese-related sulfurtransferase